MNHGPLLVAIALVLTLIALFLNTHRYVGLVGDAELYAVQAMARIHPGLAHDLFLRHGSQDKYTMFSPLYAGFIGWFGLPMAALTLSLSFKFGLFAASWALAYAASNARTACLAAALLMSADGHYGGFGVFRFAEDYLTARSPAEALAVAAIALHFYGCRAAGPVVAAVALLVHPIMALPTLLILGCLRFSPRVNLALALLGLLAVLAVSLLVPRSAPSAGPLAVLDTEWLEVVRERSVFLFPHLWKVEDWATNGRTVLCLMLCAAVLREPRLRAISHAAVFVGVTGLAIALVGATIGHIALLIQAQPWRWMWMTCLLGVLLSLPAAAVMVRDERCGSIGAMLLIGGWLLPPVLGFTCMSLATLLWLLRERAETRTLGYLRRFAAVFGMASVCWMALKTAAPEDLFRLRAAAFVVSLLLVNWVCGARSPLALSLTALLLVACSILLMPGAFPGLQRDFDLTKAAAFADWRQLIPPTSTVYVAPAHYSAAFAWFTLQRPSYLSVDQSAGVVFSRATAMEIKRRSSVLLPIMEPDWRLMTDAGEERPAGSARPVSRPLTEEGLISLCRDPQMGFVVSSEALAIGFAQRTPVGKSKHWTLYDCGQVRSVLHPERPL